MLYLSSPISHFNIELDMCPVDVAFLKSRRYGISYGGGGLCFSNNRGGATPILKF